MVKTVVIGLGSMGKRRIRLVQKYNPDIQIFGIDINEERRRECKKVYNVETFSCIEDLLKNNTANFAFICTSPIFHSSLINKCLKNNMHVFSELNLLSDGYNQNIALAKERNLILFLSSTFLYRDEIKAIKSYVNKSQCLLNYSYHVGQYLPDWHPWENYGNFFVADRRTNGCREIFAIELPWLSDTFGKITKVDCIKNKITHLDIDYNDNYLLMFQHNTGHKGLLAVDVVSRKPTRNMEIFGEKLYLFWDGCPKGLKVYNFEKNKEETIVLYNKIDQLKQYNSSIIENAYFNEIVSFFEAIDGKSSPIYSFEKDQEILKIIDEIEA